ncbi:hypothetical protein HPT29_022905 [Microvirga terrae]|uniref:Uncharacterized protein n=1 Tax=Microvirga terrae TaxID=2740529 RepID=A0ABY5RPR7_9HYPH|nr:hypothetical protein [Microvirga terrae]UVF19248.1 hypothetical protein HPT29_022905 [Microvirga terrae]
MARVTEGQSVLVDPGDIAGGHHDTILKTPSQTLDHPRADTLHGAAQSAPPLLQAGCGVIMLYARPQETSDLVDSQIRVRAKALCVDDGFDPDLTVTHAYGDDFTAQEWDSRWTSNPEVPFQEVVSPMWRLYGAHAFIELSQLRKVVEMSDNVVFFGRSKA